MPLLRRKHLQRQSLPGLQGRPPRIMKLLVNPVHFSLGTLVAPMKFKVAPMKLKATPMKLKATPMKLKFSIALSCCIGFLFAVATAQALELPVRAGYDVVGEVQIINARYEDTFADLGEAHGLGFTEMVLANPDLDAWLPGEDAAIIMPTQYILPPGPRRGIVVNLPEYRLYYYSEKAGTVVTYAVGIGRDDAPSPLTDTRVRAKIGNPAWYPPESIRREHAAQGDILPAVVPPGPNNPLGPMKIQLDLPSYLIHGSNKRFGIGMRVSHGCIRMYNRDVLALAKQLPVGVPVRFIDEPIKLGINGDDLLIEVHIFEPPMTDELLRELRVKAVNQLAALEKERGPMLIDGRKLEDALRRVSGLPEIIGQRARLSASIAQIPQS
jgi:L,D-transpeptidase ErfK/SrfK